MTTWIYLLLMLALLCGSAFFSASEMALSSANRMRLASAAEEGNRAAAIACKVIDKYENALSAILIGNNLCNIGSDSILTWIGITLLGSRYNGWVSALITLFMTAIIIVFCESAPKIAAKKNANRFSMTVAPFVRFLMIVLSPVIFLVSLLIRLITFPLKGENSGESSEEEAAAELQSIIETVEDEGVIDEDTSDLLQSALDFPDICAYEIITPRVDMIAIDIDDDESEIRETIESSPYSRIPVYEDSIDNIIGVIHLNQFLKTMSEGGTPDIRANLMPVCFVHKTTILPQVLREMREKKIHMAIVTDEYGGTMGLITMEDILEQLVGEIWDETDEIESELTKISDDLYEVDGDMRVYDFLEEFEIDDRDFDDDNATVGGWAIEQLGGYPAKGDSFDYEHLTVTVKQLKNLRITRLTVKVNEKPEEDEDEIDWEGKDD